ncbi:MAG TPA: histidine--tRNA ligase [Methanomassiliicoccales archaeon]|nr:histidine--tRNA ligase [Methanomassiliicoccales archaeon]HNX47019.1 histidine--tRNA ligase [Methanomassiliicoccales archaeon]HPR97795.1 histidine--tRNA ligase [Methanomassiliicoccales archaeon]
MIQRPRGTRDFGPEEMEVRRHFEDMMRQEAVLHGFREIATPIFEHTELFTLKSGPGVIEEIYAFQDKGGREICLRPELTASVVRFFVSDLATLPRPLKMFYFGQCFRYERPQAGRYREFFQFGAEIIGNATPETDAEAIGLAAAILERTGLQDYRIRVGHIGILREMLAQAGVSGDQASPILQKLDKKIYPEAEELMAQAGIDPQVAQDIISTTKVTGPVSVLDSREGPASDYIRQVCDILLAMGFDNVSVDLGVVRGLAYYTGMVFEVDAPKLGAEKQICGGGSYSLSELFGGEKVFSTGFAIGFDRTLLALQTEGVHFERPGITAFVVPVGDSVRSKAFEIVAELRRSGISADVDLMRRGVGKSLKFAATVPSKYALIIGEKEMESGSVTLRDMNSGEQSLVKMDELVAKLGR